jgi:serine/threonine protein kinase
LPSFIIDAPVSDFLSRYRDQPLDGKYRILERLGAGGMGEVYKVEHVYLGTIRVVKVIHPQISASSEAAERFLREARMATKVQHPNVATLHDFSGLPDGSHYMVWEFIDGENLAQVMKRRGALPARQAVRIAIDALHGLEAIHRAGIVHRDISPENLMITNTGVKIIDLGVAKSDEIDQAKTATGIFLGKLRYASPEHMGVLDEGQRIDGRADLYSLAIVLHEMLTGRPPFEATSPHQYLLHHSRETQLGPLALPAGLPPQLEPILRKVLSRNRNQRYATAGELAAALEQVENRLRDQSGAQTVVVPKREAAKTEIDPVGRRRDSRWPIVAIIAFVIAAVAAAMLYRPDATPPPIVTTTTQAAPAPVAAPTQTTIEVAPTTTTATSGERASRPLTASAELAVPEPVKPKKATAPPPEPDRARRPIEAGETPAPHVVAIAPYVEGGDGDANDRAIEAARSQLAGVTTIAVRGDGDATLTAELAKLLARNLTVAGDAGVIVHFNGTLERLGRGRKRRSATATVSKNGRVVFRYELPAEEYRVGDDPAEAAARAIANVLSP